MSNHIQRSNLAEQYRCYKPQIDRAIIKVLERGVYTFGIEVSLFEDEFAKYIVRSYAVGVASGTDALTLALKAAGIAPLDEVITTAYAPTPVPTAIVLAGGIPVFADVEEGTSLIDPKEIEKLISKKTKFIIPVHLFGSTCDMKSICHIAKRNRLTIIEDAAQAHGSTFGNEKAGRFGRLSCFSFYPTKNLGGYGDGGIVLTDDKRIADELRLLRNYGKKYNAFDSEIIGYNSRLDELQAAILRVKLRYLDKMNGRRKALVDIYRRELAATPLKFLEEYNYTKSNHHILTVLCESGRDSLRDFLKSHGIQTNVYYPRPLPRMKAFSKYVDKNDRFPVSERLSRQALALPLYSELTEEQVIFITEKIKEYFARQAPKDG